MPTAFRTSEAEDDLVQIWAFIAERNLRAAEGLLNTINEKCELLAHSPEIGRRRPELDPDLRSFPVGNYVIYYHRVEDGIEVIRVLHAARDVEVIFDDPR